MPGPLPLYRPTFPEEFLDLARRTLKARTAPAHLRQRAKLVLLLHAEPTLSNTQAGKQVDLHPNSVRLWRQRWANGDFHLEDEEGRGRKPVFSPPRAGRRHLHRL